MIATRSSLLAVAVVAGLRRAEPGARACAVVAQRAGRFRGMRRHGREGEDQGGQDLALAECNAKFAGRRKPGGGYAYYDFMQDRTFDIAGPNPTPEEQKIYRRAIHRLSRGAAAQQHRGRVHREASAAAAESQQGVQQASLRSETEQVPVPLASPVSRPRPSGHPTARRSILLRMAAAFAKHRRFEETVHCSSRARPSAADTRGLHPHRRPGERRDGSLIFSP